MGRRRHRLCIDFRSPEDLLNRFEEMRDHGVFGYDAVEHDGILDAVPKKGVGVRAMDSIDMAKEAEYEATANGVKNFPGIGLPEDLEGGRR
jgi:hypothetical protein